MSDFNRYAILIGVLTLVFIMITSIHCRSKELSPQQNEYIE